MIEYKHIKDNVTSILFGVQGCLKGQLYQSCPKIFLYLITLKIMIVYGSCEKSRTTNVGIPTKKKKPTHTSAHTCICVCIHLKLSKNNRIGWKFKLTHIQHTIYMPSYTCHEL